MSKKSRKQFDENQIENELLWSKNMDLPEEGMFRCRFCKKELSIEKQSKERPEFCMSCRGEVPAT